MPIEGLTDQRRVPRLGKIHLGVKVTNDKGIEYPKAVDYFVCPPEVIAVYGVKPTTLDVVFPSDDTERIAPAYYKAYGRSRGLIAKGDGVTRRHLVRVDEESGEITEDLARRDAKKVAWVEGPCLGRACPYYEKRECKEVMSLQFLLPRVPGLGVYQIDTSSYNSIVDILSTIDLVRALVGRISGVPLQLTLEPREVTPEGQKKKTVHTLHLRRPDKTILELGRASQGPMYALLEPPEEEEAPVGLFPTPEEQKAASEAEEEAQTGNKKEEGEGVPKGVAVGAERPPVPQPVSVPQPISEQRTLGATASPAPSKPSVSSSRNEPSVEEWSAFWGDLRSKGIDSTFVNGLFGGVLYWLKKDPIRTLEEAKGIALRTWEAKGRSPGGVKPPVAYDLTEFFEVAGSTWGLNREAVLSHLGVATESEIGDPKEAWGRLAAVVKQRKGTKASRAGP